MANELNVQKNAGITESAKKDGKIDLTAKVKIIGTGKGLPEGYEAEIHPIHAETLIKNGSAKKA